MNKNIKNIVKENLLNLNKFSIKYDGAKVENVELHFNVNESICFVYIDCASYDIINKMIKKGRIHIHHDVYGEFDSNEYGITRYYNGKDVIVVTIDINQCLVQEELDVMFRDITSKEDAEAFINKCKECLDKHICEEYILYKIEDPDGILHDALKDYYTLDRPCVMTRAADSVMMNTKLFTKNSSYDFSLSKYGVNENGNIIIVGKDNMKTE